MACGTPAYTGRFAPSPTGPLHAGSMVAALASWLDARAWNNGRGGRWLVRIEDLDTTRCSDAAAAMILRQLADCHLVPDEKPVMQTQRRERYAVALAQLVGSARAYACGCSRRDIEAALQVQGVQRSRHGERRYPGTCSSGLHGKPALSWRFRVAPHGQPHDTVCLHWHDRRLGAQRQDVQAEVGDFLLQRADGLFAYQLAVVVDDAAQQVSDVIRGADLADNTARQILLQQALGFAAPRYLHTPLVRGSDGHKLSKQNGARAVDTRHPIVVLVAAAEALGLPNHRGPVTDALACWVAAWRDLYNP